MYLYSQGVWTALHCASRAGQTAVVRVLLDNGANVHAVQEVGTCGMFLDGKVRGANHALYIHVCQY